MRIRLMASGRQRIFAVDWQSLSPHFSSEHVPPKFGSELEDLMSDFWFHKDRKNEKRFCVGEVSYFGPDEPIGFVNGRHRTHVLAKHLNEVPLAMTSDVYRQKRFAKSIIRRISKDEYIELPDIRIVPAPELAKLRTKSAR